MKMEKKMLSADTHSTKYFKFCKLTVAGVVGPSF